MTIHLVKLCVGAATVDDLQVWQAGRVKKQKAAKRPVRLIHTTRQMPKRFVELRNGGSIYWVIKGAIQVRQRLLDLEQGTNADGRRCCHLVLDPTLVLVRPKRLRAFQGWRYLDPDAAPTDLSALLTKGLQGMPNAMRQELTELALI